MFLHELKMIGLASAMAICIGTAGCAAPPELARDQIAAADYGYEITAEFAGKVIWSRLNLTLRDPESAKFHPPSEIRKYWAIDENGNYHFGWLAYYGVNAKDQYGEYTGERQYAVLIRNNIILAEFEKREGRWIPDPDDHKLYP